MRRLSLVCVIAACGGGETSVATGQLDAWVAGPSLPTPRANHCSAAIEDWVLVIGGNHMQGGEFVKTDEIHAARMGSDGVLGPWQLAGHLPSPVSECTATSDGRTLYVLDGLYDNDADGRQVFAAELDDSGMLGAPTAMAMLPQIAISSEAAVRDGQLLMMDTVLPSELDGDKTVTLRMPVAGGEWTADDWRIGFRAQAQYAFSDRFAYTFGGYGGADGNPVTAEVFFAEIQDGAIHGCHPATPLPAPTSFGEAAAVDDFVFVVGGKPEVFGDATTAVYSAQIQADGSLGAWATLDPLPVARTNHELVQVGDFLVIAGGASTGGGDATVLVSRVRF